MKVSVVIPAYNEEKRLAECLQSIKGQIEQADEIIVIDNNSTDNTTQIAKSFGVKVVEEKKQGMIPARNRGFNEAMGDIIARTDADSHVPPDWIKKIKKHFTDNPKLLGLSGPLNYYDGPLLIQNRIWPSKVIMQDMLKQVLKHDIMLGPNMALTRKAWDKVKNEVCKNDTQVHEDMDLTIHLAEYGKILFDKTLIVASSFRRFKNLKPYFEYSYRNFKTIEKHKRWIQKIKAKAISMPKTVRKRTVKTIKKIAETAKGNGFKNP